MSKELSEMSLEELWELFPIFLVKPNPDKWEADYLMMNNRIRKILNFDIANKIYHIGSTAIKGIWAKDIVDILIEFKEENSIKIAANELINNGFRLMHESENRISLNYGYTKQGFAEHVFHIHLRKHGDIDEIYFCDYLNSHPELAKEYETLKLTLWKKYEHNRDAYTDAKTEFISRWTKIAKKEISDD